MTETFSEIIARRRWRGGGGRQELQWHRQNRLCIVVTEGDQMARAVINTLAQELVFE